jgi:hypothetical protein
VSEKRAIWDFASENPGSREVVMRRRMEWNMATGLAKDFCRSTEIL